MRKRNRVSASFGVYTTGSSEVIGFTGIPSNSKYTCTYCKKPTCRLDLYYEIPLHEECSDKKKIEDLTFFDLLKLTWN